LSFFEGKRFNFFMPNNGANKDVFLDIDSKAQRIILGIKGFK
jgi:hypothetical protein